MTNSLKHLVFFFAVFGEETKILPNALSQMLLCRDWLFRTSSGSNYIWWCDDYCILTSKVKYELFPHFQMIVCIVNKKWQPMYIMTRANPRLYRVIRNYSRPRRSQRMLPLWHFGWRPNLIGPSGFETFVPHFGSWRCYRARSPTGRPAEHWERERERARERENAGYHLLLGCQQQDAVLAQKQHVYIISRSEWQFLRIMPIDTGTKYKLESPSLTLHSISEADPGPCKITSSVLLLQVHTLS